jgi:cytoskeleton protein RodZ
MSENAPPQPGPELTFGEELRKEREIRGISLAEIADTTKISKRFLEAIEKNDFATLPAPVFTRGFVREYARYLGLNAEEMVDRYAHYVRAAQLGEDDQPLPLVSSSTPGDRPSRSTSSGRRSWVVVVIALAALAAAGVALWRSGTLSRSGIVPEQTTLATSEAAAVAPEEAPAIAGPDDETLTLILEAKSRSWVVVDADGERALREEIAAGDRRTVTARERIEIKEVGDPSGLELTLNGVRLPVLGPKGRVVRDRVLDRDFLRAERARASASAEPR